jgi:hypothetical protein
MKRCHVWAAAVAITLATPSYADCQGQFTPLCWPAGCEAPDSGSPFTRVHFFPKNGNQIIISGKAETIPAGVGVVSGGVIGVTSNACIDKVCGQQLAPNTLYRVYVFMDSGTMKMDFSTGGHQADRTHGNEVHASDPTRSLVGMVRTNASGSIDGDAKRQMTISWCNRGHTGLASFVGWGGGNPATTCSSTLTEIPEHTIEFLTFGINDTFKQGFTVPNIYVSGTVVSDKYPTPPNNIGGYVHVGIAIQPEGAKQAALMSHIASYYQGSEAEAGTVHTVAIGAAGTNEGYVRATLVMSNGGFGGCVSMTSGTLFASPLHS